MGVCQSRNCGKEVDSGWSFCPNCGKDVRPFEYRPTIMNCGHKFPKPKRYCVICGEGYGGAKSAAKTQANIRFAKSLITFGLSIGGVAFYGNHVLGEGSGMGFFTIKNLWETIIQLPGLPTMRGSDLAMYVFYLGGIFIAIGLLGWASAKINEPKAQWTSTKKKKKKKPSSGGSASTTKRSSDGLEDKFSRNSVDGETRELRK